MRNKKLKHHPVGIACTLSDVVRPPLARGARRAREPALVLEILMFEHIS